jgi:hypothetical protein
VISLSKSLVVQEHNIEKTIKINDRQFVQKVVYPVFDVYPFSGVSFQPRVTEFKKIGSYQEKSVVVVPLIPQYFHNYFEFFSKLIYLQENKEKFKVVFIHNYHTKSGNVFNSLIRGSKDAIDNIGHWKEFLEYRKIEFICLTLEEFKGFTAKNTYIFYNDGEYGGLESYYNFDDKRYAVSHFLLQPNPSILVKDMEHMRNVYPKHKTLENKKIYISRKKTWDRKWDQEDALEELLVSRGYENVFMEDVEFLDQIKTIQEASHIVCLYGSALVNCSLCSTETKILSINITRGYRVPVYQDIFDHFGIRHHLLDMYPTDINTITHIEAELDYWENR